MAAAGKKSTDTTVLEPTPPGDLLQGIASAEFTKTNQAATWKTKKPTDAQQLRKKMRKAQIKYICFGFCISEMEKRQFQCARKHMFILIAAAHARCH